MPLVVLHRSESCKSSHAQRFVALEIEPLTADQKLLDLELKEIAQSLDIPKGCIDLTYGTRLSKPSIQETLNLKKSSGAVISASEASQLLQEKERIFKGKKYWIFAEKLHLQKLLGYGAKTFRVCT
jgi:hypothetical protein